MPIDIQNDTPQIALKKLKARENALRQLEAISRLGSWEVDLITKRSYWSDQSYNIYGYEPGEFTPTLDTFFQNLLPEYVEEAKRTLQRLIQTQEVGTFLAKAKRKDGKVIDILLNAQVVTDDEGNAVKIVGTTQDITAYSTLQREAKELLEILEKSTNEIYIIDINTYKYLYVNEGASKRLGYSKEEFLEMDVFDTNPHLDMQRAREIKARLLERGSVINRSIHRCKDGSEYPVQAYLQAIRYKDKDAFIIFDTDITSLVELEKSQKEQAKIVETINDGVISTDLLGNVKNINAAAKRLLRRDTLQNIDEVYDAGNTKSLLELLKEAAECSEECSKELEALFRINESGSIVCELSVTQLRDENDRVYGLVWLFQDITEKKEKEALLALQAQELEHQAHHDALTNLPNRVLFRDRLDQAIAYSKRNNKKFALYFVDLDRFKQINDSLGHQFGDKVLLEVASRIKSVLREEDTLARFGGDEFTILARDINSKEDAAFIAQKILERFKEPLHINGHSVYSSISIGVTIFPDDSQNRVDLIKFADSAMYRAKEEGRDNYRFYTADMTQSAFKKVVIENSLRSAIEQEEFEVFFQPQVEIGTNRVVGVEALVRWRHSEAGLVAPGEFLHIAQESGLIVKIDRIVMKKALQAYADWRKNGIAVERISLNLAMRQLQEDDFLEFVKEQLERFGIRPEWLEFEITENDIMRNPTRSIEILNELHKMGVKISMDDFGTGYSSLAYLSRLPLDKLKIDRSFVKEIPAERHSVEIVRMIVILAKGLGLELVAEGVETKQQCALLEEMECRTIQGFYYAKPMSGKDFEAYMLARS